MLPAPTPCVPSPAPSPPTHLTPTIISALTCPPSSACVTITTHRRLPLPCSPYPLQHEAFRRGDVDTGFIAKYGVDLTTPPPIPKVGQYLAQQLKARKGKK